MKSLIFITLCTLSFEKDVKPIFKKRCYSCHANKWLKYENVKLNVDKIYRRVVTLRTMPKNGNMPEYEREVVKEWVKKGALP